MEPDLDTLATALYVTIDDLLIDHPEIRPQRPKIGLQPKLSDAELVTLSVLQVLVGVNEEARWVRYARKHLTHLFPYIPGQAGYNKRLRKAATMIQTITMTLARDTSVFNDDVWLIDSTPVECARSRPTAQRSNLAGWAGYGYCASHSRYFWGLRLHLIATPTGLPIAYALANPKIDEREVARDMLAIDSSLVHPGQVLIADKGYVSAEFETHLNDIGVELVRPARKGEKNRRSVRQLKSVRQIIESINATLKLKLSLEHHRGNSPQGVFTRITQRLLALTAVIWHNDHTNQPVLRSLTAYDH